MHFIQIRKLPIIFLGITKQKLWLCYGQFVMNHQVIFKGEVLLFRSWHSKLKNYSFALTFAFTEQSSFRIANVQAANTSPWLCSFFCWWNLIIHASERTVSFISKQLLTQITAFKGILGIVLDGMALPLAKEFFFKECQKGSHWFFCNVQLEWGTNFVATTQQLLEIFIFSIMWRVLALDLVNQWNWYFPLFLLQR